MISCEIGNCAREPRKVISSWESRVVDGGEGSVEDVEDGGVEGGRKTRDA